MRKQFFALLDLPVEVVPAAFLGIVVLRVDGPWRWAAAAAALFFALRLRRSDTGIRLLAAVVPTALFLAAAVFWDEAPGEVRLTLVVLGIASIWVARWVGALVWPDVAIILLLGLAVMAVLDAREESLKPEPPLPAVAAFDLPESRIRPPATELKAPSDVEIVALIRTRAGPAGRVGHSAMRFEALLLTAVGRTGATKPVRVLIQRGKDGSTSADLSRAILDATEFVLLPTSECFVAPARIGLSRERAMTVLEAHGFSEATAKEYFDSFAGPVDLVPILPGARFNRYFSGGRIVGRFLTDTEFSSAAEARDGLELPESNRGSTVQTVRVVAPAMTLRGRIKGGLRRALQFLVLRTSCFDFGPGRPVESPAP